MKVKDAAKKGSKKGLNEILASLRSLKKIAPEIRAKHEKVETLEQKFMRWQKVRLPELPLDIRPYNPDWPAWFDAERRALVDLFGEEALVVHFGSTAIPELPSKNVIDMAVGLSEAPDREEWIQGLEDLGYENYGNSPIDPETLWFWRIEAERAYVVHLCHRDRPWVEDMVDLRDFLRSSAEERQGYADLKTRLASENQDQSFMQYSIKKMTLWIEMIDRAKAWRAEAGTSA